MAIRLTETKLRQIIREEASRLTRTGRLRESAGGATAVIQITDDGTYVDIEGADPSAPGLPTLERRLNSAFSKVADRGAPTSVAVDALAASLTGLARRGISSVRFEYSVEGEGYGAPLHKAGPVPLAQAVATFQQVVDEAFAGVAPSRMGEGRRRRG